MLQSTLVTQKALFMLTVLLAGLLLTGCARRGGLAAWPPFGRGPRERATETSASAPQVAGDDLQAPPYRPGASGVHKASAVEALMPSADQAPADRADEVIYCDPMLPRGHVLR